MVNRPRAADGRPDLLRRRKCLVAAAGGAGAVRGHDPKMISGARSQAADIRTDALIGVASLSLKRGGEPVASCRAILKIHGSSQPVGINRAV